MKGFSMKTILTLLAGLVMSANTYAVEPACYINPLGNSDRSVAVPMSDFQDGDFKARKGHFLKMGSMNMSETGGVSLLMTNDSQLFGYENVGITDNNYAVTVLLHSNGETYKVMTEVSQPNSSQIKFDVDMRNMLEITVRCTLH